MIRFNTQPPEGGCFGSVVSGVLALGVSTHSHPKVAANISIYTTIYTYSFNTQPPEGGCRSMPIRSIEGWSFQHTATRRWLQYIPFFQLFFPAFQHTATRRWLPLACYLRRFQFLQFQHTATRRWLLHYVQCRQ